MRGSAFRISSLAAGIVIATCLALAPVAASGPIEWLQWGQNPQHQGFVDVAGQNVNRALADIVYDPNVPAEQASTGGDLLAHYQAPLLPWQRRVHGIQDGPV